MGCSHKAIVIGAGITGLATAFRLRGLGIRAIVLEASQRAGGVISTVRRNGYLFESGPQCPRFPEPVWKLVCDLKLKNNFVAGDSKAKRFILRDGHLHPAPFSPGTFLATQLIGARSKFRIASEGLRSTNAPLQEETLAKFVQRKFGADVLDYLVDPVISTIFFGDAQKMGMNSAFPSLVDWERQNGSVLRGAIRARKSKLESRGDGNNHNVHVTDTFPSLGTFTRGMGELTETLSRELGEDLHFGAAVESVLKPRSEDRDGEPCWEIRLRGGQEFSAAALVIAAPAYAAASMLEMPAPQLSAALAKIEYAAMDVVSSAFDRGQINHPLDGFGFMVPRREGLHTICTFWNSSLFAGTAPSGKAVLTSFVRGNPEGGANALDDETLVQQVEKENAKILGITGSPQDREVWKYPQALPQFNVGHQERAAEIRGLVESLPGLYLAGNFLSGRSIGDCVQSGVDAAESLHKHLQI